MNVVEKEADELAVFCAFAKAAKLPIDFRTVRKCQPPEPDVRAWHEDEGPVAYELTELCDPDIAKVVARPEEADGKAFWTEDPSARIVQKKLLIRYETDCPVELLCYTGGRLVTPDDVIIPTLRALFEHGSGSFRKAWLFGETGVHEVWSAS